LFFIFENLVISLQIMHYWFIYMGVIQSLVKDVDVPINGWC